MQHMLQREGVQIVGGPVDHNLQELEPLLHDAVAWIAGASPIGAAHLALAPKLRLIARYGVGVDKVDLVEAKRHEVLVTNTPGTNSGAVADHALALMLAALRRVTEGDRAVRRGDHRMSPTRELRSLTVGIIGVGQIGRALASRVSNLVAGIIGYDPFVPLSDLKRANIESVSLDDIASRSDIVSLHAPGDQILIDADWLAKVRPGLILVNTARASLVDEAALSMSLACRQVACYATDTFSGEFGGAATPLLDEMFADWTIFTPHTAAQTVEAIDNMSTTAAAAVLALLRGHRPQNIINLLPDEELGQS